MSDGGPAPGREAQDGAPSESRLKPSKLRIGVALASLGAVVFVGVRDDPDLAGASSPRDRSEATGAFAKQDNSSRPASDLPA